MNNDITNLLSTLQSLVVAEVSEVLWNRTGGLCGRRDGVQDNDWSYSDGTTENNLNAFLQAWQAKLLGGEYVVFISWLDGRHTRDSTIHCTKNIYKLQISGRINRIISA